MSQSLGCFLLQSSFPLREENAKIIIIMNNSNQLGSIERQIHLHMQRFMKVVSSFFFSFFLLSIVAERNEI